MHGNTERMSLPTTQRVGHWDGDPQTGVVTWSEGMCAILGVPYLGPDGQPILYNRRSFFDRIHPEDRDDAQARLMAPYEGGHSAHTTCRLLLDDGRIRHVNVQVHLLRDAHGDVARSLGVVYDETDLRRVREEVDHMARRLERASRLTRAVSQSLDLSSMLQVVAASLEEWVRPDRISVGLIVDGDPPRQDLLGAFGRGDEAIGPGDSVPLGAELLPLVDRSKDVVHTAVGQWSGPSGRFLESHGLVEAYTFALRTDARTIGVLHLAFAEPAAMTQETLDELTELAHHIAPTMAHSLLRRRMQRREELLRHGQKLEAVGQLAAGVAHDFNNLLTVVRSSCSMLEMSLGPGPHSEDLEAIALAGERAASLTRKLLAFGRQQLVQPEAIQVDRQVAQTVGLLERVLGAQVAIHAELGAGDAAVFMDPSSLEQVLMNLAVNARDALPADGGELGIRTLVVASEHADGPPRVRLTVADTGEGMPPEVMARIFEPFFTTKGEEKGTGLGLSTAYGIVSQAGGTMEVHSQPGVGTTFIVHLPVVESEPTEPVDAALEASGDDGGTHTVLLVEDDRLVRTSVQRLLEGLGHRVISACDGPEAIEIAMTHPEPIDLLLTDLVMPGMSGREVAERMARLRPRTRVLMMSGHVEAEELESLLADGHVVLSKPFLRSTLVEAIAQRFADPPR